MSAEAMIFIHSLLLGLGMTILYRGILLLRGWLCHTRFWEGFEDVAYWLGIGGTLFWYINRYSYGIIRWFMIVGILLGVFFAVRFDFFKKVAYNKSRKKSSGGGKDYRYGKKSTYKKKTTE